MQARDAAGGVVDVEDHARPLGGRGEGRERLGVALRERGAKLVVRAARARVVEPRGDRVGQRHVAVGEELLERRKRLGAAGGDELEGPGAPGLFAIDDRRAGGVAGERQEPRDGRRARGRTGAGGAGVGSDASGGGGARAGSTRGRGRERGSSDGAGWLERARKLGARPRAHAPSALRSSVARSCRERDRVGVAAGPRVALVEQHDHRALARGGGEEAERRAVLRLEGAEGTGRRAQRAEDDRDPRCARRAGRERAGR